MLIQPLLVMLANALPAEARLVAQGCEDGRHGSSGTPSLPSGSNGSQLCHRKGIPTPPKTPECHFVMGPDSGLKSRRDRATEALCVVSGCRAL